MINYRGFTHHAVEICLLNSQYALNVLLMNQAKGTELAAAYKNVGVTLANKIRYFLNNIFLMFELIENDYQENRISRHQYVSFLLNYRNIINNNTGLDCYEHDRLIHLKQEIQLLLNKS